MKNLCYILSLFLSLSATAQVLRKPIPDKLVVLTFDDAAKTDYSFVAPILKQYGFGATFFVCEFPPDFQDTTKYMTWEQIRQLHEMGFEIGNHTHDHAHVTKLNTQQFNEELAYIEDKCRSLHIPRPVSFAYPAYVTNKMALGVLKDRGYWFARVGGDTVYNPESDHPYLIPSFSTSGGDSGKVIRAIQQAKDGRIVVLTVHGVPDYAHDWVTTPLALFGKYMKYLKDHHYTVIALRDLDKYVRFRKALDTLIPVLKK